MIEAGERAKEIETGKLLLDFQGRYIQGPRFAKAAWIQALGAVEIKKPNREEYPPGPDHWRFVCIVRGLQFDAALMITDERDWLRCLAEVDRPTRWFLIPERVVNEGSTLSIDAILPEGW